jgi:hypothetical protein
LAQSSYSNTNYKYFVLIIPFITRSSESNKFTKVELDEIIDALEDSLKYYKDLLDDASSNPETKTMNVEYARARIKIIESIKRKLEH